MAATEPPAAPRENECDPADRVDRDALASIAAGATSRDHDPARRFPTDAFVLLRERGWLAVNAIPGEVRPPAADELILVRRVAAADGSVGRIFDGHLNAIERIAVHAPSSLRDAELEATRAGELLAGVWGGEPADGEGPAAAVVAIGDSEVLRGVKTFCSGAGGLQRAAVLARRAPDPAPVLVWVDVSDTRHVEIDTTWYRSAGLVASTSHRVVFHDAPILARLGTPGEILQQPWFGRDALRTTASWAGMADTAVSGALDALRSDQPSELEALAVGRILTEQRTIDTWLTAAARAMDEATSAHATDHACDELTAVALHARAAIADACRRLLDEASRACGSRPFATRSALDRARRDLELFLLQHRLDPMLGRAGRAALTPEQRS